MQVSLDCGQSDVDDGHVHTDDEQAGAADGENQIWMGGAFLRISNSGQRWVLSLRQGVSI